MDLSASVELHLRTSVEREMLRSERERGRGTTRYDMQHSSGTSSTVKVVFCEASPRKGAKKRSKDGQLVPKRDVARHREAKLQNRARRKKEGRWGAMNRTCKRVKHFSDWGVERGSRKNKKKEVQPA